MHFGGHKRGIGASHMSNNQLLILVEAMNLSQLRSARVAKQTISLSPDSVGSPSSAKATPWQVSKCGTKLQHSQIHSISFLSHTHRHRDRVNGRWGRRRRAQQDALWPLAYQLQAKFWRRPSPTNRGGPREPLPGSWRGTTLLRSLGCSRVDIILYYTSTCSNL